MGLMEEMGMNTDKFAITGLTPQHADHVDAPCIAGFPGVLEWRVTRQVEIGSHTRFIGKILDVKIDESMLDTYHYKSGLPYARFQLPVHRCLEEPECQSLT